MAMNPSDPFSVLAQVLPRARSEQELVDMAAQLAPPPPAGFRPAALPQSGVARFQQPQGGIGNLVAGGPGPGVVPPMTQGESRTRIGQYLVGG